MRRTMCDLATISRCWRVLLFAVALLAISSVARAQQGLHFSTPIDDGPTVSQEAAKGSVVLTPQEMQKTQDETGVDDKLGQLIPLDQTFVDENGKTVRLGEYFQPGRPVVLQLGYYKCPMLCSLVSRGIQQALMTVPDLSMPQDFQVIFVSIDPRETPADAASRKSEFVEGYTRGDASAGAHFLTGSAQAITALSAAVGFRYKWIESAGQFSHPAVAIVLTGDGKVSHYLYGVNFAPTEVAETLKAASDGKLTASVDEPLILTCLHAIIGGGSTAMATALMRTGGVLTMLVVGIYLFRRWIKDSRATGVKIPAMSATPQPASGAGPAARH